MTLQRSQKQLQMMTIVLLTGVVFFSTMIYFLEKDEEKTPFTSIPAAYWWCKFQCKKIFYLVFRYCYNDYGRFKFSNKKFFKDKKI